jgi:hypothetical protein
MANKDNLGSAHNDPISTLFEPDALASQQYETVFHSRQISPEKRLILAILDDAVQSFVATMRPRSPKELREFQEAQTWIMEANSDWIFSFDSICNQLGLDPDYLRSGLQKLKAEARNGQHSRPVRANRLPRARTALGRAVLRLKAVQSSRRVFSANHDSGA